MYYQIKETLTKCKMEECKSKEYPYVAVTTREEFESHRDVFDMGIDMDLSFEQYGTTKVEVNYDSLTGHFSIPSRKEDDESRANFAFVLDERGIVFIGDDGVAQRLVNRVQISKRWKFPSLERFLFDFLEGIVSDDLLILEGFDKEMDDMEDKILDGETEGIMTRLVDIKSQLLDLRPHYEQLIDMAQELEENENGLFVDDNLRYFHLYKERVSRLQDVLTSLREHTIQIRDLYQTQMDVQQNKNMTVLTIIAAIFTPLTLITGWFGMNFKYMPELDEPLAYPIVALVCVLIVIGAIIFFKRKKML